MSTAAGVLVDFVNGYALAAGAAAAVEGDPMGDRLAALPAGEAPAMRRSAAAGSLSGYFDSGVEIIVRGVSGR